MVNYNEMMGKLAMDQLRNPNYDRTAEGMDVLNQHEDGYVYSVNITQEIFVPEINEQLNLPAFSVQELGTLKRVQSRVAEIRNKGLGPVKYELSQWNANEWHVKASATKTEMLYAQCTYVCFVPDVEFQEWVKSDKDLEEAYGHLHVSEA